jgi:hypothetical protein
MKGFGMRFFLSVIAAVAIAASLRAERPDGDGLVFNSVFDSGKAVGVASGGKHVQGGGPEEPGAVRSGPRGRAALELNRVPLWFPSNGIFNPNNGTLTFWIKPLDWGNGQKLPAGTTFVPIFTEDEKDGGNWTLHLFFSSDDPDGQRCRLQFESYFQNTRRKIHLAGYLEPGELKKDSWTQIALVWSNMGISAFVNGRRLGEADYGMPLNKKDDPKRRLWFLPVSFWGKTIAAGTGIADIRLYNHALSPAFIRENYEIQSPASAPLPPPAAPVPLVTAPPHIDGSLSDPGWNLSARLPVMVMNASRIFNSDWPAWVMAAHDKKHLYIACDIHSDGRFSTPGREDAFDRGLFGGDSFEVYLRRPGGPAEAYLQIGVAPNNAVAMRDTKGQWAPLPGVVCRALRRGTGWSAEMAVPLSLLPPPEGNSREIEANFGLHRPLQINDLFDSWLAWSAGGESKSFASNLGVISLLEDAAGVRLGGLDKLNYGEIKLEISGLPGRKTDLILNINGKGREIRREVTVGEAYPPFSLAEKLDFNGVGRLSLSGGSPDAIFRFDADFFVRDAFTMTTLCHASKRELDVRVDIRALAAKYASEMRSGRLRCCLSLIKRDDQSVYGQAEHTLKDFDQTLKLPFQELPASAYRVRAELILPDNVMVREQEFIRPSPVFLADRKGADRSVPGPWLPLTSAGGRVKTAFHEYKFGTGLLPEAAWSQSEAVLDAPPVITATVGGREFRFEPAESRETEAAPDRVTAAGRELCPGAGLELRWRRETAFDGMIRCDIKLLPTTGAKTVDKLKLQFHVPSRHAVYAMTPTFAADWLRDSKSSAFPIVWLNGGKVGFCLFTDNDANWVYDDKDTEKPLRLRRDGSGAVMEAVLINAPVTLSEPAGYVIGLMATPGKPPRADWRELHAEGHGLIKGENLQIVWTMPPRTFTQGYLISEPRPDAIRHWIDTYRRCGVPRLVPYCWPGGIPTNNPIHDYYGADWEQTVRGVPLPKIDLNKDENGKQYYFAGLPHENQLKN